MEGEGGGGVHECMQAYQAALPCKVRGEQKYGPRREGLVTLTVMTTAAHTVQAFIADFARATRFVELLLG